MRERIKQGHLVKKKTTIKKSKKPSGKLRKPDKNKPTPKIAKKITVDFTHHQEIYDKILSMASEQLRTPENQALYMFKLIHEKGKDALKVEEQLKFP